VRTLQEAGSGSKIAYAAGITKYSTKGVNTMHIEAELDDLHAERLLELQKHSNKSLPQLVTEMLARAI
jgi:hypothetical protein